MEENCSKAVKVFYSYAHEDDLLRNELERHLGAMKRSGLITTWHDREIRPGTEWGREIDAHLNTADIVLLLVSPHFIDSDYCYGIEMRRALERHKAREALVIPIILRPVDWEGTPISELQVLPIEGKAITRWRNRDEVFSDIAREIRQRASLLLSHKWRREGNFHRDAQRYEEALVAFEQAIRLAPGNPADYMSKGDILQVLERYDEALIAYEQAISLDSNNAYLHMEKGYVLSLLGRYNEKLAAFEQAIRLAPGNAYFQKEKGRALLSLKRYEEALVAFEQAIRLEPNLPSPYYLKSIVLRKLGRLDEAEQISKKVRELGSDGLFDS